MTKGIKDGTFVTLTPEEIEKLKTNPHHFTFHSTVFSQNSATMKVILVNNTWTCIPGELTTISTQQVCPSKTLNSQLQVLYRHSCYDTPLLKNILSCYHSIEVNEQTQLLRLLLWFEVDLDTGKIYLDRPIIFKRKNLDFGDVPASQ